MYELRIYMATIFLSNSLLLFLFLCVPLCPYVWFSNVYLLSVTRNKRLHHSGFYSLPLFLCFFLCLWFSLNLIMFTYVYSSCEKHRHCSLSCSLTLSFIPWPSYSLFPTLLHTHSLTHSFSHTHSLPHSHIFSLLLSLALSLLAFPMRIASYFFTIVFSPDLVSLSPSLAIYFSLSLPPPFLFYVALLLTFLRRLTRRHL